MLFEMNKCFLFCLQFMKRNIITFALWQRKYESSKILGEYRSSSLINEVVAIIVLACCFCLLLF